MSNGILYILINGKIIFAFQSCWVVSFNFIQIYILQATGAQPDQTLHCASDLILHCLPISLQKDAGLNELTFLLLKIPFPEKAAAKMYLPLET